MSEVGVPGTEYGALVVETLPELEGGDWRPRSWRVLEVREKLRKRIVVGRLRYADGVDRRVRSAEIVAKIYGRDRGMPAFTALGQLWAAGFRAPSPYRVTRPYGYSPRAGVLVQARAPGVSWATFLHGDDHGLVRASARAAAWLVRLQRSAVPAEPKAWSRDVATADRLIAALVAGQPAAARLERVGARLLAALAHGGGELVPSHGDYHPKNVFLTPRTVTLIDFDTFGLREPAVDVGYGIGQLLIMASFQTGQFAAGARAGLAFWRGYQDAGGTATWSRVAVQVARSFLLSLHYELQVLRNGRVELLEWWPALMARWMDADDPTILEDLLRDQ